MPRALWITEESPDRDLGGGSIRQAHLVEALGRRVPTDLLLVGTLADPITRSALAEIAELPSPPTFRPPNKLVRRLVDLWVALLERGTRETFDLRRARRAIAASLADRSDRSDRYDLVVVNHQGLLPLLPRARPGCWVAHLHNVAGQRARQAASAEPGRRQRWLLLREAAKADRLEQWAVASYDAVVVCSEEDAETLTAPGRAPASGPILVVPNGVDARRFVPTPLPSDPTIVLTASLDYLPNVDGVCWFVEEVLPLVRDQVPDAAFDVVGRHPTEAVRRLSEHPGVRVHADVPAVAPYLSSARVAVVPLRMGTGTRLKALEALAAGRPLVGTSIGLAGLGLVDGVHARIADEPEAMAKAILELLGSDDTAERLAATDRQLVDDRYGWDRIGDAFVEALLRAALP